MAETTDTQDFQPAGGTELRRAIGATLGSEVGDTASSLFERGQRETFGAARAKADREAAGAAAKAGATRDYATEMQRQTTAAEGRIGQMPQFEVNKDTQEGLMGLAALLPLAGLMLGIKGQTSGTNALNAMAGVMTGYKEGNQQRIEFERKKYDEEMNRWKANYGMVKDGLERAMSIAKANLQAGQAEAERVAATVGSPELTAMIRSQGLSSAYDKIVKIGEEKAKTDAKVSQFGVMSDDAAKMRAERLLAGDQTAQQNLGTGQVGVANRSKLDAEVARIASERGLSGADVARTRQEYVATTQAARSLGTYEARLEAITAVLNSAVPAAEEMSDKVPRGKFVPLNKLIQNGKIMTSDPDMYEFGMANLQLAEAWAKSMNPTGVMRNEDRDKALEFLSTATSPDVYKRLVNRLKTQVEREKNGLEEARKSVTARTSQQTTSSARLPATGPKKVTKEEYDRLESGEQFIAADDPQQIVRTKP